MVINMKHTSDIKRFRESFKLTQQQLAELLNIPVKNIQNWEQGQRTPSPWVIDLIYDRVIASKQNNKVLTFLEIKKGVQEVAKKYPISKVYLFGSYAKGEATPNSDIDLYVETKLYGLDYFELSEAFRKKLADHKIDMLTPKTINKDSMIDKEIKETGIQIYG
jgi:predicted nucleotidyltransferase